MDKSNLIYVVIGLAVGIPSGFAIHDMILRYQQLHESPPVQELEILRDPETGRRTDIVIRQTPAT